MIYPVHIHELYCPMRVFPHCGWLSDWGAARKATATLLLYQPRIQGFPGGPKQVLKRQNNGNLMCIYIYKSCRIVYSSV